MEGFENDFTEGDLLEGEAEYADPFFTENNTWEENDDDELDVDEDWEE